MIIKCVKPNVQRSTAISELEVRIITNSATFTKLCVDQPISLVNVNGIKK